MFEKYSANSHMVTPPILQQEYEMISYVITYNCRHCSKSNIWYQPGLGVPRNVAGFIRSLSGHGTSLAIWRRKESTGAGAQFLLVQNPVEEKNVYFSITASWGGPAEDITETIRRCRTRYEDETAALHRNIFQKAGHCFMQILRYGRPARHPA